MKKVLLIDDDADQLLIYSMVIEDLGYEVVATADARQGLETLKRDSVDLLISDLMMPGCTGDELVEEVRKIELLNELPIILMSGAARDDIIEKLEDPFTLFVEKGRDMTRMLDAIKKCMGDL